MAVSAFVEISDSVIARDTCYKSVKARIMFCERLELSIASELERGLCALHLSLEGSFAGLTDEGLLQLRLGDGSLHIVNAGDVRLKQD